MTTASIGRGLDVAKILLIEDDMSFAQVLRETLSNYDVDHVTDGPRGLQWLKECHYEGAIVDWQLPLMDGIEVCSRYRQEGGTTPILMLTANDQTRHQVVSLDSGADDYLSKPFDAAVLLARLRALLRRGSEIKVEIISVGRLSLNTRFKVLSVDRHPLHLTKREYAIMELLMRANGEPISSTAILERVWPSDSIVSPENVRCHVARIRTQIGKISKEAADCVRSEYGVGYAVKAPQ